jgi:tetratricopeptide (TPR) repeat protein/transglutaminase-like putative cysteine protease
MFRARAGLLILSFFCAAVLAAQGPGPKSDVAKPDHSLEAFVIEHFSRTQQFENDGTSTLQDEARVRVQSEAGVQQYGVLAFSYASGTTTFQIDYTRVRKPDGSVVDTPSENVQDMAADITRVAPFYSDLHEKHVAVKGLSVGDVLEYRIEQHTTKPLAPGQFWTDYHFTEDQIILDEQLLVRVPRDRAVKVKSAKIQPTITESGAYRVYTWQNKNLRHKDDSDKKRDGTKQIWLQAQGRLPHPDVQLSSFTSWEDVGRWYGGLQEDRVKPTPEITAKADELTRNAANDDAKVRALYAYVGTQFHYIGIAFGIGRYRPHSAAEVLANQYGDCKDKHTLLASLLTAAGIPAYPALISTTHDVDQDVPSPGQFDHVITVIPRSDGLMWLDSTAEVGPYQFLISPLRDKHALAVWKDKPPALVNTPADLPFPQTQSFHMDAKLSDSGVLEGHAKLVSRGDLEYLFRAAFRTIPLPQWKELVQRISANAGFGGEVSDVVASSPEKTDEPFAISYTYTRKDFGDWPNHRIVAPEPFVMLPAPGEEELLPVGPSWLGAPVEMHFDSSVELPPGYKPELPAGTHLKKDFAQFDSTCNFQDGKMLCERHLKTLLREVPVGEREDYKQFVKTVSDDYGAFIPLLSESSTPSLPQTGAYSPFSPPGSNRQFEPIAKSLADLPSSLNPEAARLETEARNAMGTGNSQTAISSLYRAVAADPNFVRAWVVLGGVLLMQKQKDAAIEAFQKAMALDPTQTAIPKTLAMGLMANSQFEEAIPIWQDFIHKHPDDADGPADLAQCFVRLNRYSDAEKQYEALMNLGGNQAFVQAQLGSLYLRTGDREKAAASFSKLAELDPKPQTFNTVAYQMSNADLQLPLALKYAQNAVKAVEEESQKITLENLSLDDLQHIFPLAAYWDTLGWANERMTHMDLAEQYLKAAWRLTQNGVVAGHLCHLYKRVHQDALAVEMCHLAIYRIPLSEGLDPNEAQTEIAAARENLALLSPHGRDDRKDLNDATNVVVRQRRFTLPRFLPGTASAEFFVLLSSDGKSKTFKVENSKFISGSDKLKAQGKQLKGIALNMPAPDDVPAHFVWRGILGCYEYSGCSFVLLDPASVHSLD